MYKKILVLILFGFVEHKSEALCCFSKKAVQRPAPAQSAPTAAPVATFAPEDPDAGALRAIRFRLARIQELNEAISRMKQGVTAAGKELESHRYMCSFMVEKRSSERAEQLDNLRIAVKLLRNDKNYENFMQSFHADVFHKSRGHFYADDKELHERDLGVLLPIAKPLIGIVSSYLWQHGKSMKVHRADEFIDSISIFDAQGNQHMLTSPRSRTLFENISSLRIMPYIHLRGIAFLENYALKERPQDPEAQAAEDRELDALEQERAITGLTSDYAKERQLLLVPVID